ncbi:MAG: hypothetical protein NZ922_05365 [Candidatus Methanomethyliaceae archaeon]|nr:hypothetical protein [Candidatus Methanomethyliaceae archaeon]MDW7970600.1 hypothetical protein [Nitrososphaerota archaeon]
MALLRSFKEIRSAETIIAIIHGFSVITLVVMRFMDISVST